MVSLSKGRWLCQSGWWLFPKCVVPRRFEIPDRRMETCTSARESCKAVLQDAVDADVILYSAQPRWSLADIQVSRAEVPELVAEFLKFVEVTALEFCWVLPFGCHRKDLKRHAWKHVSYSVLKELTADIKARRYSPPEVIIDELGGRDAARASFRCAERRDPKAVSRISAFLPTESGRQAAARALFHDCEPSEPVPHVPGIVELGIRYLRIIAQNPHSPEADRARGDLRQLVSARTVKGSSLSKGRPRAGYHREAVEAMLLMGNALFLQLREVKGLLDKQQEPRRVTEFYPWLSPVLKDKDYDLQSLLKTEPFRAGALIVSHLLEISPSKIEKLVYRRRG